ncbi:unnamed protein product [Parajaminaea phylloscopi]
MDELILFLTEELAMDGESGTDQARFAGFIQAYHEREAKERPEVPRTVVDEAYRDYVWACLYQQPGVHVGIRVRAKGHGQADASEPRRKKTSKSVKLSELIDTVTVIPKEVAQRGSLSSLLEEYGKELRIVLDEDVVRFHIAGTTDKNFVPATVWGTLQLVARTRAKALSSLEIGRVLGYDAKTVFYFTKTLMKLGLVTKFQAFENKTSANFVLHRRYWEQNANWLSIRNTQRADEKIRRVNARGKVSRNSLGATAAEDAEDDDGDDDAHGDQREEASDAASLEQLLDTSAHVFAACPPIERQILDAIKASGPRGMTIAELSQHFQASHFAKRHFEETIHSIEAVRVTAGHPDLSLHCVMEKLGKERRIRVRAGTGFLQWGAAQAGVELGHRFRALEELDPKAFAGFTCFPSEFDDLGQTIVDPVASKEASSQQKPTKAPRKPAPPRKPQTPKAPKANANPVDPVTGRPRKGRPRKSDIAARKETPKRKAGPTEVADGATGSNLSGEGAGATEPMAPPAKRVKTTKRTDTAESHGVSPVPAPATNDISCETSASGAENSVQDRSDGQLSGAEAARNPKSGPKTTLQPEPPFSTPDGGTLSPNGVTQPAIALSNRDAVSAPAAHSNSTPSKLASLETSETKATPKAGTPSTGFRQRIDITAEQRARLVLDVLNHYGGIAEDAYLCGLVEDYLSDKQGLDVAHLRSVGHLTDSKTRQRAILLLKDRGQVKITQTKSLIISKGTAGKAWRKIVYRSDIPDAQLAAFVRRVQEGSHPSYDQLKVDQTTARPAARRSSIDPERVVEASSVERTLYTAPLEQLINDEGTKALFGDLPVARSQPYGYVPGQMSRLHILHFFILQRIEESDGDERTDGVLSQAEGIVDIWDLFSTMPLKTVVRLTTVGWASPELRTALDDSATSSKPAVEQAGAIRAALGLDATEQAIRDIVKEYCSSYVALRLAEPVQLLTDGNDGSATFERVPFGPEHRLFRFRHAHLQDGKFSLSGPSGFGRMTTSHDAHRYWKKLRLGGYEQSNRMRAYAKSPGSDPQPTAAVFVGLAMVISNKKRWNEGTVLSKRQMRFLKRFTTWPSEKEPGSILDHPELVTKLAACSLISVDVVRYFLEREVPSRPRTIKRVRRRSAALEPTSVERARVTEGSPDAPTGEERTVSTKARRESAVKAPGAPKAATKTKDARRETRSTSKENSAPPFAEQSKMHPTSQAALHNRRANRASLRQQIRDERRDKELDWQSRIDEVCADAGVSIERRAKIEDALSEYRDEYVNGSSSVPVEMLTLMIHSAASGERQSQQYPSSVSKPLTRAQARQTEESFGDASERKIRSRRKGEQLIWSREADELLRDACVILTARDRARVGGRSNWTPLLQIFPDWQVARLRQRYLMLADAIGEEAYLSQLEREWTKLWEAYRETAILPDGDPLKADKFDLNLHVQFLRAHIDKDQVLETVEKAAAGDTLPASLAHLEGNWVLRDSGDRRQASSLILHDLDAAITMTRKEEALAEHAVTLVNLQSPGAVTDSDNAKEREKMAECVIRMCIETDKSQWDQEQALALCQSVGESHIEHACQNLLLEKLIRTEQREGRRVPGRNFTYADRLLREANSEPFNLGLVAEATTSEDTFWQRLADKDGVDIGPTTDTGDTVVIANALASGQLDPVIDTEQIAPLRDELFFNAKSVTDCDNELTISLRRGEVDVTESQSLARIKSPSSVEPTAASWLPLPDDYEDRDASAWAALAERHVKGATAVVRLKEMLAIAGESGIPVRTLHDEVFPALFGSPDPALWSDLLNIPSADPQQATAPPLAFLAGYGDLSLISTRFLSRRCVTTLSTVKTDGPRLQKWLQPRSWLSISGQFLEEKWLRGARQVLSHVLLRPGISRAFLADLLGKVWDREEVRDLVRAVAGTGIIEERRSITPLVATNSRAATDPVSPSGDDDVCLMPTGRCWYRVSL